MDFHLDSLLNLPNVTVFTHRQKSDYIILQLELLNDGIVCPHCQKYSDELNQNRPILVRDLSISGQSIYLQVPRRQFYCKYCRKYSTESLTWMEMGRHHTLRYEEYIYEKAKDMTVKQVSRNEGISIDTIELIVQRVNQRKKLEIQKV
ncbi:MAG: transposase family protein [Symploca sp. SIO2E6]|nr:transposase family protein [Symploca sp. SIO2E6]